MKEQMPHPEEDDEELQRHQFTCQCFGFGLRFNISTPAGPMPRSPT